MTRQVIRNESENVMITSHVFIIDLISEFSIIDSMSASVYNENFHSLGKAYEGRMNMK